MGFLQTVETATEREPIGEMSVVEGTGERGGWGRTRETGKEGIKRKWVNWGREGESSGKAVQHFTIAELTKTRGGVGPVSKNRNRGKRSFEEKGGGGGSNC